MTDTPADTLRAAAKLLRGQAVAAQGELLNEHFVSDLTNGFPGPVGAYAALMHPGVGELIAAWLESAAENTPYDPNAIIVAAAILDSPPVSIVTGGDCQ